METVNVLVRVDGQEDLLIFDMGPPYRACLRPSGTEPKTKVYFEASGRLGPGRTLDTLRAEINDVLGEIVNDFIDQMLSRAGLSRSHQGLVLVGLDALDKITDFDRLLLSSC